MAEQERFFVCKDCGELTTWTDIMNDCSSGGQGMCMCEFMSWEWSTEFNDVDVWFPRIYKEYIEITKKWFDKLKTEYNHVIRLKIFNTIPIDERMRLEDLI